MVHMVYVHVSIFCSLVDLKVMQYTFPCILYTIIYMCCISLQLTVTLFTLVLLAVDVKDQEVKVDFPETLFYWTGLMSEMELVSSTDADSR